MKEEHRTSRLAHRPAGERGQRLGEVLKERALGCLDEQLRRHARLQAQRGMIAQRGSIDFDGGDEPGFAGLLRGDAIGRDEDDLAGQSGVVRASNAVRRTSAAELSRT